MVLFSTRIQPVMPISSCVFCKRLNSFHHSKYPSEQKALNSYCYHFVFYAIYLPYHLLHHIVWYITKINSVMHSASFQWYANITYFLAKTQQFNFKINKYLWTKRIHPLPLSLPPPQNSRWKIWPQSLGIVIHEMEKILWNVRASKYSV